MDVNEFNRHRTMVTTRSGDIAYADFGSAGGRVVLFVHGVGTSGYLWRNVIAQLGGDTRSLAIDLPLHGRTAAGPGQDLSPPAMARALEDFCDALGLSGIDLVANDTGGAIAQIFAASNAVRLRTLTLTDCDTQDNIPPEAFAPTVALAARGELAPIGLELVKNPASALSGPGIGDGYQYPERLDTSVVLEYLEPVFGTLEQGRQFERILTSLRPADLLEIESALKELTVPTLIVWGTADPFFDLRWAYWLRDTIPGATEVVEIEGGKLFFPDERADEFVPHLRRFWDSQ